MYNAEIGRFVQRDPIGCAAGVNLFSYVGSDPTSGLDPSGLAETLLSPSAESTSEIGVIRGDGGPVTDADRACCREAYRNSEANSWGTLACCSGKKVLCIYTDRIRGYGIRDPLALAIARLCVAAHEYTHSHQFECEAELQDKCEHLQHKHPTGKYSDWKYGYYRREKAAFAAELRCLRTGIEKCRDDAECRRQVQMAIDRAEKALKICDLYLPTEEQGW